MKVIILAGGLGTRLSEYTESIPKPMVRVGGMPIIWHIMNIYAKFNHKDFYLALGYKSEIVKQFFLNYRSVNSDFTINLDTGDLKIHNNIRLNWNVTLIDTGLRTMTGGRVKRLKKYINNETFFLTYGDGVSNINLDSLLDFHKKHGKIATLTAVRPPARFGDLEFEENSIKSFQEKSQLHEGWINGGFFVFNSEIFDYIDGDEMMLEREPLTRLLADNQLMAYKHNDFWQCMDTKRDHEILENIWNRSASWSL